MLGILISGERVALTPPPDGFAALMREWYADPVVTRHLGQRFPMTLKGMEDWLGRLVTGSSSVVWAMRAEDRTIGIAMLNNVHWRKRQAEIGMCIGAMDTWSKGYGREAAVLLTRFAFEELGLEKVTGSLLTENVASRRMMERIGYRQYGIARHDEYRHGRWHDAWLCEALRDEWLAERPATRVD